MTLPSSGHVDSHKSSTGGSPLGDLSSLFGGSLPPDAAIIEQWKSRTACLYRIKGSGPAPWSDLVVKVPGPGRQFEPDLLTEHARWLDEVFKERGRAGCDVPIPLAYDTDVPALCLPYIEGWDLTDAFRVLDVADRDILLKRCGRLLGTIHMAGRKNDFLNVEQRTAAIAAMTRTCHRVGASYGRIVRRSGHPYIVWSADDFGPTNVRISSDDRLKLLDLPSRPIGRVAEADLARFILGCWQGLSVYGGRPPREVWASIEHFLDGYSETGPLSRDNVNRELIYLGVAYLFLKKALMRARGKKLRDAQRMTVAFLHWRLRPLRPRPAA